MSNDKCFNADTFNTFHLDIDLKFELRHLNLVLKDISQESVPDPFLSSQGYTFWL